ncbi:hypothetical protein L1987_54330 [Smallanthus sonchifolius]|uniref:Uncharacterized protein n=1 Tax=Smallanthus sonchifolius TaxID=185202 RepID=A0ACB9E6Q8_9ASTR|nr:hypothetical protein L1987_54330 [Smallanthus sonchifolius]
MKAFNYFIRCFSFLVYLILGFISDLLLILVNQLYPLKKRPAVFEQYALKEFGLGSSTSIQLTIRRTKLEVCFNGGKVSNCISNATHFVVTSLP